MLTVARVVLDHAGAVAAVVAPVVGLQVHATEAAGAVLSELVGAEGAELAGRRRHVVIRALAAVADVHSLDAAVLALEGSHAAALEVAEAKHGVAGRARIDARTVEEVRAVTADAACAPQDCREYAEGPSNTASSLGVGIQERNRPGIGTSIPKKDRSQITDHRNGEEKVAFEAKILQVSPVGARLQ